MTPSNSADPKIRGQVQTSRNYLLRGPSYRQFCPKIRCHGNGGWQGEILNDTVKLADSENYTLKPKITTLSDSISNVTDGFWRFLFIWTLISCVLISPGSAKAYFGWGGNLNNRLMQVVSRIVVPKIIKIRYSGFILWSINFVFVLCLTVYVTYTQWLKIKRK